MVPMYRVLCVDDERLTLDLLKNIVPWERLGIESAGAVQNAALARTMMEELRPDILITDIRMPGEDGLSLIQWVRERGFHTKIIILSAYGEFEYAKRAIEYDTSDYLLKPIEEEAIEKVLGKVVRELESESSPQNISREIMLRELLLSRGKDIESSIRSLSEKDQSLFHRFTLILFRFRKDPQSYDQRNRDVRALLEGLAGRDAQNDLILKYTDREWLLIGAGDSVPPDEAAERLIASLGGVRHCVAVRSKCYSGLQELWPAYCEVSRLLSLHDYFPEIRLVSKYRLRTLFRPAELELSSILEMLKGSMGSSDTRSIRTHLKDYMDTVCSIWDQQHHVAHAVFRLWRAVSLSLFPEEPISEGADDFYKRYPGREQLSRFLEEAVLAMDKRYSSRIRHYSLPVKRIVSYIEEHYAETPSLDDLSREAAVSRNYLSSLFKKETGENVWDFLSRTRIRNACRLLESGKYRSYEVAEKVGYDNQAYFSRVFKKVMGVSPSAYRKGLKESEPANRK